MDAAWALMLDDGRGGFGDFGKYRKTLSDLIWLGKEPELTDKERAEATRETIGSPIPSDALDEARRLRERMNARHAEPAQ